MIYVVLDILIYNLTIYSSFFFLINLNRKSLSYNLALGLFIDFVLLKTYFLNTILILIFYLIRHYFLKINYGKFINYFFFNLGIVLIYILMTTGLFSYFNLKNILLSLLINSIFISISYIKDSKDIKLIR